MLKNVRKRALISCCFPNRVYKLHFDACESLEICPKRSGCVYSELHKYYLNKIPQTSNFEFCVITLEEAHWLKPPTLARHHTTICMSYFMTGGPGKEQGTSKLPPTQESSGKVKRRRHMSDHLPESFWASILAEQGCTTRKDSEKNDWLKTTRKLIPSP